MDNQEPEEGCTCNFNLGVNLLASQDVHNSQEFERKYNLVNQAIHFLGSCNSSERCTIKDKIEEVRKRVAEFYFDKDEKLIAIPNQMPLPNKPNILDPDEPDEKKRKLNNVYMDKYCEDLLHQSLIKSVREMEIHAFIIKGFQSNDCMKAKLEKGKTVRTESKCRCKADKECNCGKSKYPELNEHEKDIMEILDINDIEEDELARCSDLLGQFKANGKWPVENTWLFNKVKKNVGKDLKNVSDEDSGSFFRYHWFTNKVHEISMEWDSLIILPQSKMIINIEVKTGTGINALKTAAKQTNIHLSIFRKIFCALLSDEWRFVKAACTPNLVLVGDNQPCGYCTQYIVKQSDMMKIKPWLELLKNDISSFTEDNFKTEYDNLLVSIIGFSAIKQSEKMNKLIVDPHDFSKETERKITNTTHGIHGENEKSRNLLLDAYEGKVDNSDFLCYMLTPDQLNAVKDTSTHTIIEGDYGCGKTYVLKERARLCAEKYPNSKIAYINLTFSLFKEDKLDFKNTIMDLIAKNDFKNYKNIDVITSKDLANHHSNEGIMDDKMWNIWSFALQNFLNHNKICYEHVFIDEYPPLREIKGYPDFIDRERTFCISMKCDERKHNVNEDWIRQIIENYDAKRITLNYNMRNTETIVNMANLFSGSINSSFNPQKNISGPVCYHYCNIYKLDSSLLARAAINKYFFNKKKEPVIIICNREDLDLRNIYAYLKRSIFPKRNITSCFPEYPKDDQYNKDIKEVLDYLKKPEGILVTSMDSFNGAQARNVIILVDSRFYRTPFLTKYYHENYGLCNSYS